MRSTQHLRISAHHIKQESSRTFVGIACAGAAWWMASTEEGDVPSTTHIFTSKEQEAINTLTAGFLANLYAPTEKVTEKLSELQYVIPFSL